MQKFYVDGSGSLLGSYDGPEEICPYPGATAVDTPPQYPGQLWNGAAWAFSKPALKQLAAEKRWERETGGIAIGGIPVKTDRESQSLIMGAHITASITQANVKWKSDAGFVELTPDQITGMALAVSAHVQACFTAEANILPLIEDGTIATVDAVLLWEGWPQ